MQPKEAKAQLRKKLKVSAKNIKGINDYLLDPSNKLMDAMLDVVLKYAANNLWKD